MNRRLFILVFLFFVSLCMGFLHVNAQEWSLEQLDTSFTEGYKTMLFPSSYVNYSLSEKTGAVVTTKSHHFNQGLTSDPLQLLRGKLAGVQTTNRGGNPNTFSLLRVRGFSAYSQRQPLLVVDGLVDVSLESLDPNDIASISVLKDGSAQALYGIRASNGVVLVTTKSGAEATQPFSVHYTGQLALAVPYDGLPIMDATAFRTTGGIDLGASTDWQNQVLRNGISQNHGLAITGRTPETKTYYRISGNFRQIEGVLQKSGFEQLNIRAKFHTDFGLKKFNWDLSTAYTNRDRQLGFPEALGYATTFNPTAPVYTRDAPFTVNPTQFGSYFELIGLSDNYNPKAMIDLNDHFGQQQTWNAVSSFSYEFTEGLKLNLRYGFQEQFLNDRLFFSPQALYFGNALGWQNLPKGSADLQDFDESLSLYEVFANFHKSLGKLNFYLTLGTSYKRSRHQDRSISIAGIDYKNQIEKRRIPDFSDWQVENRMIRDSSINGWNDNLSAFFGQGHYVIGNQFFLDFSLRYEGSSKLGTNNRWGWFPALGAAVDIADHFPGFDQLKIRAGYGLTGALPDQAGLSKERALVVITTDSATIRDIIQPANPDLEWEKKQEINLGVDFRAGRLSGFFNWYHRQVFDCIMKENFEYNYDRYTNQNAFTSSGFELEVDMAMVETPSLGYSTGVRFSYYQSQYSKVEKDVLMISQSCCVSAEPLIVGKKGEVFGNLMGPVFSGKTDAFGDQVYQDLNEDGMIGVGLYDAFTPESDTKVIGNGLPSVELGWFHQLSLGRWELHTFFRSVLGHSLVNRARQKWEPRFNNNRAYNYVNTEFAVNDLLTSRYSSLYVEKADFIKLEYFSLAYNLPIKNQNNHMLTFWFTVQNVLIASRYSGPDPEPAFEDTGYSRLGSPVNRLQPNPLAPGIDRMNAYLPAKSYVFGLRFR